ncbi:MAG TPA: ABC transporter substrate-binding protein [Acidimicrobiales bacterium]|nr:ABC transporter substrate-binding protein [Acidimicrobiales bacterium]
MATDHERLDGLRRNQGPIPEHVIDEFVAGRLSRRDFLRRGALVGLSFPVLGGIVAACGSSSTSGGSTGGTSSSGSTSSSSGAGKAGATIRAGFIAPSATPNPLLVNDQGGLELLNQTGEMLIYYDADNNPHPSLATSWSPNADATVWTFKIRQGVKFANGSPMTVDDVVYSLKAQCDPKNNGNALSVFGGTLVPDGVVKVDSETVAFHLEVPYGAFPSAVSTANYNVIIVPAGTDFTTWPKTFIGTGPFMLQSFNETVGANFVRNPHYWGAQAKPAKLEVTFYPDEPPMTAALQAGSIDCVDQFTVSTSPQLLNGNYNVVTIKASTHRELSMRNDMAPFDNKYVRQAIALTLNRPAIVHALFSGEAQVGNDSPFAPSFPQTDTSVPQRQQDLKLARQLLARGGVGRGFSANLVTEQLQEIPRYAQIVKQYASQIGVDIKLTIESQSKYYGQAVFGKSDWLDGEMSIVDYGARPVPNLFLEAPLQSINAKTGQGAWNAARFDNPTYDRLSKEFIAAADLSSQRRLAGQIQRLLLDETPIVYAYFYDYLAASAKNVHGINPQAGAQFFLNDVTKA